jgi:hypothetical protein
MLELFVALSVGPASPNLGLPFFAQTPNSMRIAENFSTNVLYSEGIERLFLKGLPAASGAPFSLIVKPTDDALRLLRSGTFDVMAVQMGSAAPDKPSVEGIDLVGVSTDVASLRRVVDCGVTSPDSGNSGKWPEVTNHDFPLSFSGSVQGCFANLDFWNKVFSKQDDVKLAGQWKA